MRAREPLADTDGVRLYEESKRADWAKQTAVVMWVGYDAPNTVFDPGLYEPNAAYAHRRPATGRRRELLLAAGPPGETYTHDGGRPFVRIHGRI